ncbi:MAG: hypothetical protein NTZ04_04925 [Chloroflexi bacterium]|nr:hypothetical protein [Chloroflexota bacterium]
MDEKGKMIGQGQVANNLEAVRWFPGQAGVDGESTAVLETTRNWTLMHDWPSV